jgi:hypothetical protein
MHVDDLLREPEGKTLEFKSNLLSLRRLPCSLVAYANSAGGTAAARGFDDRIDAQPRRGEGERHGG